MSEIKHEGLPVQGYKAQFPAAVEKVNRSKEIEEQVLRLLDELAADPETDKRWLATGRTDIEKGFMSVNRSVFKPGRARLPGEARDPSAQSPSREV